MSISATFSSAVDVDATLNGTLTIDTSAYTGTPITLDATVTYASTGAVYTSSPITYDGTSSSTFTFTNGTTMTLDQTTGGIVYTRIARETTDGVVDTYVFTFTLSDGTTTETATKNVTTLKNIQITTFEVSPANDVVATLSGMIDVTVLNDSTTTISVGVAGATYEAGAAKNFKNSIAKYIWSFPSGGELTLNMATNSWTYKRPTSEVGDLKPNSYTFNVSLTDGSLVDSAYATVTTTVSYPPTVKSFDVGLAYDTDEKLTGDLSIDNVEGCNIALVVSRNGYIYSGGAKAYASTMTWTFGGLSTFTWDNTTKKWEYERDATVVGDNSSDVYVFNLEATNTVGTDSATCSVETIVPKAVIENFSTAATMDGEASIVGVLNITMPEVKYSPSLKIDISRNGTVYEGTPTELGEEPITFTYSDGTTFTYSPVSASFAYKRNVEDIEDTTADTYIFDVTVKVNGQTTTTSLIAKTMAGRRIYSYEPAYPIHFVAGGAETADSAWPKVILEFERIYRLFNENMNYYESMFQELNRRMTALEEYVKWLEETLNKRIDDLIEELTKKMEELKKWTVDTINDNVQVFGDYTSIGRSGTAPSDGFLMITTDNGWYGDKLVCYVNGNLVAYRSGDGSYGGSQNTNCVPVKKGDSFSIGGAVYWVKFFAMKSPIKK